MEGPRPGDRVLLLVGLVADELQQRYRVGEFTVDGPPQKKIITGKITATAVSAILPMERRESKSKVTSGIVKSLDNPPAPDPLSGPPAG